MKGNTNAIVVNGGGTPTGDFKVRVIDYDGSVIEETYCNLNDEYTLPTPPTHSGLTFQEWNSPYQIVDNKITVTDDVLVGAIYVTTSGDTEFDIELTPASGLTVNFRMTGTKDWGDNVTDSSTTHTYSAYGNYTIKCSSGTMNTSSTYGLFGQDTSSSDTASNTTLKAVRFGTGVSQIGQYAFTKCSSLKSVSFSKSVTALGNYGFSSDSNIKAIVLPSTLNLTATTGNYIGNYAFAYCRKLEDIIIPKGATSLPAYFLNGCGSLKELILPESVGTGGFYQYCLANCYVLEKIVYLGSTLEPGSYSLNQCYSLKNVDVTKFRNILYQYMFASDYKLGENLEFTGINEIQTYAFGSCYGVKKIKFNSNVSTIAEYAFNSCKSMEEYNFKANTAVPTLSNVNAFNGISDLCKIKVPWNLYQNWIIASNWSTYANYIDGGTPATITFTGDNTGNIYVNNNLISGTSTTWVGTNMPYYVYDSTNNIVLPDQTLTGIIEGSSQTVNIDLSSKNKITLETGVTGLDVTFTIDGKTYTATEESVSTNTTRAVEDPSANPNDPSISTPNGNYYIYVVGSGISVDYYINGGTGYMDSSGTVSTANQDISIPVTLTEATVQTFTRPNLTANGTLGGDSFAVGAQSGNTQYQAYYAVNGNGGNYWIGTTYTSSGTSYLPRYYMYNPNPLKISQLILTFTGTSYMPNAQSSTINNLSIYACDDNESYKSLALNYTISGNAITVTITNPKNYKYYRIHLRPKQTQVRVSDIAITGEEKVASNTSNIGEPTK